MGCKSEEPDIIKELREEEKIGNLKGYFKKIYGHESFEIENNEDLIENVPESNDLFRNIVDNCPDGIVFVNKFGIIKFSNNAGAELIGYNKEHIIGKHFSKIGAFKVAEIPKYIKIFKSIIKGKNPGLLEIEYQRRDGSTFLAEVKIELLKNKYNKIMGIIAISRDITDKKNYETKIIENENRYRIVSELATDFTYSIIVGKNNELNFEWVTKALENISGYSMNDLKNKGGWEFLIYKDDIKTAKNQLKTLLEGNACSVEYRIKTKSGKIKWIHDYAKPIYNEEKKRITHIYGAVKDVTESKKYESSITESKLNLQNLFNSIADPIVIVDSKGKFLDMNNSVTNYTDYSRDDLIGKNFLKTKIVTKKSKLTLLANLTKRMAGITVKPYIVEILTKNGDTLPFEVNAQKIEYFGKPADLVIFRDISERIRAEKALKTSEIRYRTLFETSEDGILIAKLDDKISFIDCNPKALQLFKCKKNDIIGKSPLDFSPEYQKEGGKSKDLAFEKLSNAVKNIDNYSYEWKYNSFDGNTFDAEVNLAIIELEGEKYIQTIVRDITDRKKAELSIKESEERYRALFFNNVDLLFIHDLKDDQPSNFIEVNDKFCDVLGYSKEELLKMNIKDLVIDEYHSKLEENITKLKNGQDVLFEIQMISKNNEKIPLEVHKTIIIVNDRKNVLGIARDITDRKIAEEELQKLAAVVKHSGELVNLANLDGKMIFLNEAGEKMLGIHPNKVKNHMIYDVIPKDLQLIVKSQVVPSIINKGFWDGELRYKNVETGEETNVFALTFLIKDPDTNKPLYLANVSRDITEQKRDQRKLEKAHNELKDLNEKLEDKVKERTKQIHNLLRQKDEFINQLGHDLKNPLGPLVNLLPIVEKEEKDPKLKDILRVINRNVDYMRNLVIKTIQLARLNSPKTEFNFENTNLLEITDFVIKNNELLFKENKINVMNNISKEINLNIDKLRYEELLNNLLNNSVKFSKESGLIKIDSKDDDEFIRISISDNGIGMTDKQLNHMFDEFYKADESRHDFDSSGLGLSISKKIVEKHGGKIWAESEGIGKGSTFYFTLPVKN